MLTDLFNFLPCCCSDDIQVDSARIDLNFILFSSDGVQVDSGRIDLNFIRTRVSPLSRLDNTIQQYKTKSFPCLRLLYWDRFFFHPLESLSNNGLFHRNRPVFCLVLVSPFRCRFSGMCCGSIVFLLCEKSSPVLFFVSKISKHACGR